MDDILFETEDFITLLPNFPLGGEILSFSMDGNNYDFEQEPIVFDNKETSHIFIT
jgi:hypothetical protein